VSSKAWLKTPAVRALKIRESTEYCDIDVKYPQLEIAFIDDVLKQWAIKSTDNFCSDQTDLAPSDKFYEHLYCDYRILKSSENILSIYMEGGSAAADGPTYMEFKTFNFDLRTQKLLKITDVVEILAAPVDTTDTNDMFSQPSSLEEVTEFLISPEGLILFNSIGLGGVEPWLLDHNSLRRFSPKLTIWHFSDSRSFSISSLA